MPLTADSVKAWLEARCGEFGRPSRCVVAYSGGRDSTVLLALLAEIAASLDVELLAAHVNHGLQHSADEWQAHCEQQAARLDVAFQAIRVEVARSGDDGPEGNARVARYRALAALLNDGDWLLTAHHQDDQAETVLLHLMRGTGVNGMRGIATCRALGRGMLLRPLLGFGATDITAVARQKNLSWVEDASNTETAYDRNFLRREVLPVLAGRWPAAARQLARSAELAVEAAVLLDEVAEQDTAACGAPARLSTNGLSALPAARCRNVIRYACRRLELPTPPARMLDSILTDLLTAREDAQPLVSWSGAEARRYREHLYLLPTPDETPANGVARLLPGAALTLGSGMGRLCLARDAGGGIAPKLAKAGLDVRYRQGGETLRPAGRGATRTLKKLMQEEGVLPWMRERLPLLYAGEALVAVGDLWVAEPCFATNGYAVVWEGKPPLS